MAAWIAGIRENAFFVVRRCLSVRYETVRGSNWLARVVRFLITEMVTWSTIEPEALFVTVYYRRSLRPKPFLLSRVDDVYSTYVEGQMGIGRGKTTAMP